MISSARSLSHYLRYFRSAPEHFCAVDRQARFFRVVVDEPHGLIVERRRLDDLAEDRFTGRARADDQYPLPAGVLNALNLADEGGDEPRPADEDEQAKAVYEEYAPRIAVKFVDQIEGNYQEHGAYEDRLDDLKSVDDAGEPPQPPVHPAIPESREPDQDDERQCVEHYPGDVRGDAHLEPDGKGRDIRKAYQSDVGADHCHAPEIVEDAREELLMRYCRHEHSRGWNVVETCSS